MTDLPDRAADGEVADGMGATAAGRLPIPARFAAISDGRFEFGRSVTHLNAGRWGQAIPRVDGKG